MPQRPHHVRVKSAFFSGHACRHEILMTEPVAVSFARKFVKVGCCCRVAAKSMGDQT
jgi:hypothetical protein